MLRQSVLLRSENEACCALRFVYHALSVPEIPYLYRAIHGARYELGLIELQALMKHVQ